ncbi:MAG: hypothetical protein Q7K40_01945 [bacterium]|nr:hypothetical protein [bacterium]
MNLFCKKSTIILILIVVMILGSTILYYLSRESRILRQVGNYPDKNLYTASSTTSHNQNSITQQEQFVVDNKGVYQNTVYGYEIEYPKGTKIGPLFEEFLRLPMNELMAVRLSTTDSKATLDIFAGQWEVMVPMVGMGIDIGTLYADDLKAFAQKIWKLQGEDFDHKVAESVTDLVTVPFAGVQAYSFTATQKGGTYLQHATGRGDIEKNFLIFEHLGKKIVIMYSNKNDTIETMKNSFKFINK